MNPRRGCAVRLLMAAAALALIAAAGLGVALWWILSSDHVRRTLEAQATRVLGQPVRIERASATLLPRPGVRLLGLHVGEDGDTASLGEVRLSTGLRPLFARRIDDADVLVRDGHVDLPALIALYQAASQPAGTGDAPASADGFVVGSIRSLDLENVDLRSGDVVLRSRGRARVREGQLEIERFEAAGAGSEFELRGVVTGGPAPSADLTLAATELDGDALAGLAGALGASQPGPGSPAAAPAVRLTMAVQAQRARLAGITFATLESRVEAGGPEVRLDPLSATMFGGRFTGGVRLLRGGTGPLVRVVGNLADADAAALLEHLGVGREIMTGRVSANLRVDQAAGPADSLLRRLRGTAGVTARDGVIQNLSMVRHAIVELSGRADRAPADGSDRYERMSGTFGLSKGRLDTRDLTLVTEDLEVLGRGSIDLTTQALALDADLVLGPALSEAAGRDLFRYAREGDRIVLPARIGGTFSNPRVTLDVVDAARRALRNRLQEEASSLLERLRRGGRQRE